MDDTSQGRARLSSRRGTPLCWLLLFTAVSWSIGCNSLNFLRPHDKIPDKVDRPPVEQVAGPTTPPGKYAFRIAPYVFLSDWEIPRDMPLFAELSQLRDQVYKELLLPPGDAVVQVYLFENEWRYKTFMKARYPDLPERRAFFVAQPRGRTEDLLVYTYWGERIRQDLRHELTHALVHSVIKNVPLWLDEGLAEYFELPPEQHGVNSSHVEVLLRNGASKFNLARLEALERVEDMTPTEYRESWGWVHLMLRTNADAKTVLLSYLQQLRGVSRPGQLGPKLLHVYPRMEEALAKDLESLQKTRVANLTGVASKAGSSTR